MQPGLQFTPRAWRDHALCWGLSLGVHLALLAGWLAAASPSPKPSFPSKAAAMQVHWLAVGSAGPSRQLAATRPQPVSRRAATPVVPSVPRVQATSLPSVATVAAEPAAVDPAPVTGVVFAPTAVGGWGGSTGRGWGQRAAPAPSDLALAQAAAQAAWLAAQERARRDAQGQQLIAALQAQLQSWPVQPQAAAWRCLLPRLASADPSCGGPPPGVVAADWRSLQADARMYYQLVPAAPDLMLWPAPGGWQLQPVPAATLALTQQD